MCVLLACSMCTTSVCAWCPGSQKRALELGMAVNYHSGAWNQMGSSAGETANSTLRAREPCAQRSALLPQSQPVVKVHHKCQGVKRQHMKGGLELNFENFLFYIM